MNDSKYIQIAKDIAIKITKNEFPEGSILKGRTLLASLYNVSPETIRKAIQILAKEKILYVKHGVGVFVDSKIKAEKYLSSFEISNDIDDKKSQIKDLLKKVTQLNKEIEERFDEYEQISRYNISEAISFYETYIKNDCFIINHTLSEVYFWNYTEATVIAIKRKDGMLIVSPGPDIPLFAGDKIIFACKDELTYERVLSFLKYGIEEE